jgi:hypothetical protein
MKSKSKYNTCSAINVNIMVAPQDLLQPASSQQEKPILTEAFATQDQHC